MEKVVWNFELDIIKEYLSRFYCSDFACIREYVANAIAAQHRAGVTDPIYVEISPERIVVEDKGIGISKQKFKEIFMWFGRSENREIEGIQGKFGLGAKSFMMLTGDTGKVIMRTRSRETGEAYSAILTSTGAEIIDGGGKEDYGTRFEIYPEEPLTAEKAGKFYEGVAEHFDFSRIPIHVRAYANEPFEIHCIAGYELNVVEDSEKMYTKNVKLIEAVFGVQNHKVNVIEDNEVYELGILETVPYHELRWSSRDRTAVVVGDVLVDRSPSKPGFFLRIKVEDGRDVKIGGVDVKAPEPLPNRDGYRGLEELLRVVKLLYEMKLFERAGYSKYVKVSPMDLASLGNGFLKDLLKRAARIRDDTYTCSYPYTCSYLKKECDEKLRQAVERELPGFHEFYKLLTKLLTELPAYGTWGYVESNGRRREVTVADVLNAHYVFHRKVGYVRRRPSKRREQVMEEENVCAVYTENPDLIEFLEMNGIREVKVRDRKTRVKVYSSVWNRFEGGDAEYVDFDRLVCGWNGEVFIYAEKVSEIKGKFLPYCKVVVGGRKLYRKLKEVFGDFAMTYGEWKGMVRNTTLVTDGYKDMTLGEALSNAATFVETPHTALLPALRKAVDSRIYTFVDATDYTHAGGLFRARELKEWFEDWCKGSPSWRARMAEKVNSEAAEMLHLLLIHGMDYNSIQDDLIGMVCRYAGVEKGKTMDELKELAKPFVEKIVEKYGTLKLGKFPVKAFIYRHPMEKEDLEGLTAEGVRLVNPLIPSFTYDLAGKAGDEVRKLRELQIRFGIFGALVYHAEKRGMLGERSAREVVEKYLPMFARSKDDWVLLVKLAPRVSRKQALLALL